MKLNRVAKLGLSAASLYGGYKLLKNTDKEGELSGRVNLYHGTAKKNEDSIKKEGLKTSHADDEDTILKKTYGKDYIPHDSNIYLARNKRLAKEVNSARYLNSLNSEDREEAEWKSVANPEEYMKDVESKNSILKLKMHRSDFKKLKLNENPELLGAKNSIDFAKRYEKKNHDRLIREGASVSFPAKAIRGIGIAGSYNDFKNNTITVGEDVKSKYIEGSNDFKKTSRLEDFKRNIKENPKDVVKGVGKATLGAGLLALGARGIWKNK